MGKIYYPGNNDELIPYHQCNSKCFTIHYSWGKYTTNHYYTKEEDSAIEQGIDDYTESQVDERKFAGGTR